MILSSLDSLRHPPEAVVTFIRQLIRDNRSPRARERRSDPREPISIPVEVQPLDSRLEPLGDPFATLTKDISTGGIGILHNEEVSAPYLEIGMEIRPAGKISLLAQVKHCTAFGAVYHIGARFVVDWSYWRHKTQANSLADQPSDTCEDPLPSHREVQP